MVAAARPGAGQRAYPRNQEKVPKVSKSHDVGHFAAFWGRGGMKVHTPKETEVDTTWPR